MRTASLDDADAIDRIEQASFATDRLSRRNIRRGLREGKGRFLIASFGATPAGYALLGLTRGARAARLYSLAVDPAARGRGVGEALLDAALQTAYADGKKAVRLEVRTSNAAARALYERAGFIRIGEIDTYYEDGAPALRMERTLLPKTTASVDASPPSRTAARAR